MRAQEVAYLRQQDWKMRGRDHHDGSQAMLSPDGSVWAVIGFNLSGFCNFHVDRKTLSGRPSMCSSLVEG